MSERGGSELIRGGLSKKGKKRDQFDQQCEANDANLNVRKSKHLPSLPGMKYTFDLQ